MSPTERLAASWREEAERIEDRYKNPDLAEMWRDRAAELEAAIEEERKEVYDYGKACAESGYSYSQIRDLRRNGKLTKVRTADGRPGVLASELPKRPKPRHRVVPAPNPMPSPAVPLGTPGAPKAAPKRQRRRE